MSVPKLCAKALFERFSTKKDGTLWYYSSLFAVFKDRGVPMATAAESLGVTLDDLTAACERYPLFGQAVDDAVFLQGRYRANLERLEE